MKLYTEEQMRKAIRNAYLLKTISPINDWIEDSIINHHTPIELPSEKDIDDRIASMKGRVLIEKEFYESGIYWMRNQIKFQIKKIEEGGNK